MFFGHTVRVYVSPCECETVGLFQWKEFAAAPFYSSLTLYKTQQDTNMNVCLRTQVCVHALSHIIK